MPTQFPAANLPVDSMKWGREIQRALNAVERGVDSLVNRDGNNSSSSTSSLAKIASQVAELATTQDTLVAAGQVAQSETQPNATVRLGFYDGAGRPEVVLSSPTGKLDIQFGGSLNSGNGVLVISVTGVDNGVTYVNRATMANNYAQRLAMSGGSNFTPSAYRSMVVNVDPDAKVRVRLEINAFTDGIFFVGGSVLARASL